MFKKLLNKPHFLISLATIFITAFIIIFNIFDPLPATFITPPPPIDPGDIRISAIAEDSVGGVADADVSIKCDGGEDWGYLGRTNEEGVILFDSGVVLGGGGGGNEVGSETEGEGDIGPVNIPVEADCQNNENIDIKIIKDGYVARTSMGENTYLVREGNNYNIYDIQFALRVNLTREQDRLGISGAIITAGANQVSCFEGETFSYYCPVVPGDDGGTEDIIVSADGYVVDRRYDTLNRESNNDPQSVVDISDIRFAYKITNIYTEGTLQENITDSVSSLELGDETGYDSCTLIEGVWYCPVLLANSDGVMVGRVTKDGYVQGQYALNNGTKRIAQSDPQVEENVIDVKYAMAVTVTNNNGGAAINNASVKVGNSLSITCAINGNDGVYSCILPQEHTDNLLRVSANDYVIKDVEYDLRGSQDSEQVLVSVQLELVTSQEVSPAAPTNTNISLPVHLRKDKKSESLTADVATGPVAEEAVVEEKIEIKETDLAAESKILSETEPQKLPQVLAPGSSPSVGSVIKDIIQKVADIITPGKGQTTQVTAPAAFIEYGTTLTAKIGVGERAGVVSSFEKVYGRAPQTQDDWQDVIKIANGHFPANTVPEKEKSTSEIFEKIYLRAPDLNKEKEKAAVTIMTYGVRPAKRSLTSESRAIGSFKSIFGYLPKTTADWDIVRGIAYSGVSR